MKSKLTKSILLSSILALSASSLLAQPTPVTTLNWIGATDSWGTKATNWNENSALNASDIFNIRVTDDYVIATPKMAVSNTALIANVNQIYANTASDFSFDARVNTSYLFKNAIDSDDTTVIAPKLSFLGNGANYTFNTLYDIDAGVDSITFEVGAGAKLTYGVNTKPANTSVSSIFKGPGEIVLGANINLPGLNSAGGGTTTFTDGITVTGTWYSFCALNSTGGSTRGAVTFDNATFKMNANSFTNRNMDITIGSGGFTFQNDGYNAGNVGFAIFANNTNFKGSGNVTLAGDGITSVGTSTAQAAWTGHWIVKGNAVFTSFAPGTVGRSQIMELDGGKLWTNVNDYDGTTTPTRMSPTHSDKISSIGTSAGNSMELQVTSNGATIVNSHTSKVFTFGTNVSFSGSGDVMITGMDDQTKTFTANTKTVFNNNGGDAKNNSGFSGKWVIDKDTSAQFVNFSDNVMGTGGVKLNGGSKLIVTGAGSQTLNKDIILQGKGTSTIALNCTLTTSVLDGDNKLMGGLKGDGSVRIVVDGSTTPHALVGLYLQSRMNITGDLIMGSGTTLRIYSGYIGSESPISEKCAGFTFSYNNDLGRVNKIVMESGSNFALATNQNNYFFIDIDSFADGVSFDNEILMEGFDLVSYLEAGNRNYLNFAVAGKDPRAGQGFRFDRIGESDLYQYVEKNDEGDILGTWSINVTNTGAYLGFAAVPEASEVAAMFGLIALGFVACRRKRS